MDAASQDLLHKLACWIFEWYYEKFYFFVSSVGNFGVKTFDILTFLPQFGYGSKICIELFQGCLTESLCYSNQKKKII